MRTHHSASTNLLVLGNLLLLGACGPAVGVGDSGDGSTGGTATTGAPVTSATTGTPPSPLTSGPMSATVDPSWEVTTAPPPETDTWGTDTFETEGSGDTGYEFIIPPDGGGCGVNTPPGTLEHCSYFCDTWEYDCGRGEKCTAWANDGSDQWNAFVCQPVDPMPDLVGSPCTAEGSGVSGVDTCEASAICWNVDPDTLEGVCVAYCGGTEENPLCAPGETCVTANDAVLNLCLPTCDPLAAAACSEGEGCYPSGRPHAEGPFACIRSLDPIVVDDLEHPSCAPGSFLASGEQNAECGDQPCCTSFCDLSSPACPDTHTCEPYFEEGKAPGGSNVGFCRVGG